MEDRAVARRARDQIAFGYDSDEDIQEDRTLCPRSTCLPALEHPNDFFGYDSGEDQLVVETLEPRRVEVHRDRVCDRAMAIELPLSSHTDRAGNNNQPLATGDVPAWAPTPLAPSHASDETSELSWERATHDIRHRWTAEGWSPLRVLVTPGALASQRSLSSPRSLSGAVVAASTGEHRGDSPLLVALPQPRTIMSILATVDPYKARLDNMSAVLEVDLRDRCAVCLDGMLQGQRCSCLLCGHRFHADCIISWMHEASTCPLCKRPALD